MAQIYSLPRKSSPTLAEIVHDKTLPKLTISQIKNEYTSALFKFAVELIENDEVKKSEAVIKLIELIHKLDGNSTPESSKSLLEKINSI